MRASASMLLVPVVLCVSLSSCKSPEEKARATLLGNWRGGVQIVGAPPVDVKMSFTSDGRYTESRSVATIPGLTGGGTWRLVGATQITLTPASAPPASPSPAARALMPLSGTLALGVYGNDRIRIGELDLGRAPLAPRLAERSGASRVPRGFGGRSPHRRRSQHAGGARGREQRAERGVV